MNHRVQVSSTSEFVLRRVPGLLERVESQVLGILRCAEELRDHQWRGMDLSGGFRLHIAGHVVWYQLYPEQKLAVILTVEQEREADVAALHAQGREQRTA